MFDRGRMRAMFRKEFIQIRRDRRTLAIVLVLPVMQLLLLGYGINTVVDHLPTIVLDESRDPDSRALVAAFQNSGYFDVVAYAPYGSAQTLGSGAGGMRLVPTHSSAFDTLQMRTDIPPFDEDEEAYPAEAVTGLRQAIQNADAVFFTTPEYNSSIPGALKNALDWVSRPFATNAMRNKPVAVVCHGVEIAAAAGVLRGRTLTTVAKCALDITQVGGTYADRNCVVDGHLVSARTWHDNTALLKQFVRMLKEARDRL